MKKILYLATIVLALAFTSCSKEEPGGTATQATAGEWYVTATAVHTDGTEEEWDGPYIIRTFNTSENVSTKMYISDVSTVSYGIAYAGQKGYWNLFGFYVPVTVDPTTMTFSTSGTIKNLMPNYATYVKNYGMAEYADVTITNGKIAYGGGKQNNGSVADAIEFDIKLVNDYYDFGYADTEAGYYAEQKIDHFHISGVRYSGLTEND